MIVKERVLLKPARSTAAGVLVAMKHELWTVPVALRAIPVAEVFPLSVSSQLKAARRNKLYSLNDCVRAMTCPERWAAVALFEMTLQWATASRAQHDAVILEFCNSWRSTPAGLSSPPGAPLMVPPRVHGHRINHLFYTPPRHSEDNVIEMSFIHTVTDSVPRTYPHTTLAAHDLVVHTTW